jgi:hypothetical protein
MLESPQEPSSDAELLAFEAGCWCIYFASTAGWLVAVRSRRSSRAAAWRSRWESDPEGRRQPDPHPWAWRLLGPDGDRSAGTGPGSVSPRGGRTVRGHAIWPDRLLHQASDDGGPARCRQLQDRSAARHATRWPARTGVTLPAGVSLPAPRPGAAGSITARTIANARSTSSSSMAAGSTCTWGPAGTLGAGVAAFNLGRPVAFAGLDAVAVAVRRPPGAAPGYRLGPVGWAFLADSGVGLSGEAFVEGGGAILGPAVTGARPGSGSGRSRCRAAAGPCRGSRRTPSTGRSPSWRARRWPTS